MLVHGSYRVRAARRRLAMLPTHGAPGRSRVPDDAQEREIVAAVALVATGIATSVTIVNVEAAGLAASAAAAAASAGVAFRLRSGRNGDPFLEFRVRGSG